MSFRSIESSQDQVLNEIDDTYTQKCGRPTALFGNPDVNLIQVADAPDSVVIDERINENRNDPESDGIDFPQMKRYILQIWMKNPVYLQYVIVPSSNVKLFYVNVYYSSKRRHRAYLSKIKDNPVVENFLTDEPTNHFEVQLNATDNGLPPSDVTLIVVSNNYVNNSMKSFEFDVF